MVRIYSFLLILFLFSDSAFAGITVYGRVTGTNGELMSVAHVFLTYPSDDRPVKSVVVQKNGKFRIEIDSLGLWVLHFTGTFHHTFQVAIYANTTKNIKLEVKLKTYSYVTNYNEAGVIGNFNRWSSSNPIKFTKDPNGTYSAIVKTKYDTVFYRLINVRPDGGVEGVYANGFVPNGVEGYNSFLITKRGKVKIVLDPQKLLYSDQSASFKFTPADSIESRFAAAYATLTETRQTYKSNLYAQLAEHHLRYKFDFTPYIDTVKNLLNQESNGLIRQVLQLSYFGLCYMSSFSRYVDGKTSRQTLEDIPPNSIVWSLEPAYISEAMKFAGISERKAAEYIHKVLDTNPMNRTKEILLRDEIDRMFYSLNYVRILPYLAILSDRYGDSPEAVIDRKGYSNYIQLKDGIQAPAFSVVSLSDSSRHFTNDSFGGKYYLLNFWQQQIQHQSIK